MIPLPCPWLSPLFFLVFKGLLAGEIVSYGMKLIGDSQSYQLFFLFFIFLLVIVPPVFGSAKITNYLPNSFSVESISLSRHINSETIFKYHLYYNLITDSVNLVDKRRVYGVICNYNLSQRFVLMTSNAIILYHFK